MYFLNKTLLPILCVAIALSACKDETSKSNNVKPVSVTVLEVKNQDIPLEFEYTARAQGSKETEVRARVDGILLKRHYIEGSEVKEGDSIKIVDGPFVGMVGKIESVDLENKIVNAIVDLFGQETSIEVELKQIDRI